MNTNINLIIAFVMLLISCKSKVIEENIALSEAVDTLMIADTLTPPKVAIKMIEYDYDTLEWTDIALLDSSVVLDLKYATTDNFVKSQMYDCPRCFLRPKVAKSLVAAHQKLKQKGYGLKMYDCYRPRPIQWELWKKVPDPRYVADPRKGSMHNRGGAVDLTIVDSLGMELDMGTEFDFFGKRAYQAFTDLPAEVLSNRKLLRETMDEFGFSAIKTEWWHYSFRSKKYELSDMVWNCNKE